MKAENEKILKGKFPPPDTKSWHEYSWRMQQQVPNRIEDAAKFLATIISISLTIVLAALEHLQDTFPNIIWLGLFIAFWILALFVAFWVLFPKKYRFQSKSVESIKQMQQKIVRLKSFLLLMAMALYFLPFVLLFVIKILS